MPDEQYRLVGVRSNVDRLSASSVHELFRDLVGRANRSGRDWMRIVVPKGDSQRLARAVDTTGPSSEGAAISASVGIPPILGADVSNGTYFPGEQSSGDYPLFVDRGTGMFGPTHAPITGRRGWMVFEGREGTTVFAKSVAGQPGQHFMLSTYEQMTRVALPVERERFAERVKHLYADPNPIT
jgi:hypothetical protein